MNSRTQLTVSIESCIVTRRALIKITHNIQVIINYIYKLSIVYVIEEDENVVFN